LKRQPNVLYEPEIKLCRSFEQSLTLRNTHYITQSTGLTKLNNLILTFRCDIPVVFYKLITNISVSHICCVLTDRYICN